MAKEKRNYLKYYRVIKQFMKIKHKIREDQLDILMFLYSEETCDRARLLEFETILIWDKMRISNLLIDGWITTVKASNKNNSVRKLYKLSVKGQNLVEKFYDYLEGAEIPMTSTLNPEYRRNVSYTEKVYRNMIKKMNEQIYASKREKHYEVPPGIFD